MIIPINPESITISLPSSSKTENVLGIGEVSVPQTNSLSTIEIESAFYRYWIDAYPAKHQYSTTKAYEDWFKTWQKSKLPAQFTVEELGYNLRVTCEAFNCTVNSGEEDDIYYTLSLQEYRQYGAKTISVSTDTGEATVAAETRADTSPAVEQTYTVSSGDNLWAISKKLSGDGSNWQALYEANKAVIGDNPNLIYAGQVYVVPTDWVTPVVQSVSTSSVVDTSTSTSTTSVRTLPHSSSGSSSETSISGGGRQ